jgi:hypothetical protein
VTEPQSQKVCFATLKKLIVAWIPGLDVVYNIHGISGLYSTYLNYDVACDILLIEEYLCYWSCPRLGVEELLFTQIVPCTFNVFFKSPFDVNDGQVLRICFKWSFLSNPAHS